MVDYPRRWDIKAIRKFMITFGLVSSVFDYLTFGALLTILHATPGSIQNRLVHGIGRVSLADRLDHQNETAILQKQTSQASMDSDVVGGLGRSGVALYGIELALRFHSHAA